MKNHEVLEKNIGLLTLFMILAVSIGGLTQIVPLFFQDAVNETERYGHYSVAGESVYDHPFLWGSKRTGPDLARVGGRYSDDWHRAHLYNPRNVVPESKMPSYPWLVENTLDGKDTAKKMSALRTLGVPYTEEDIAGAKDAVRGKTEMDAMVAYLQVLGTALTNKR